MKNSEALYRKYRFDSFNDIFGQNHISRTLKNAIKHGKVSHAYLFSGPRGTGKTSTARLLAKTLNCSSIETIDPCGVCENCVAVTSGSYLDIIELDAASHTGVDNIRSIIEEANFHPTLGKYKIYIIDEAHMLSKAANNAFLKTLEEPPEHVIFILATTESQKIISTIHSRCQCFNFKRISYTDIVERLNGIIALENEELEVKIDIDLEALTIIAKNATGSMRDGISTLEQILSFTEGKITADDVLLVIGKIGHDTLLDFIDSILKKDIKKGLLLIEELTDSGINFNDFFSELVIMLRNLLLVNNGINSEELLQAGKEVIKSMKEISSNHSDETLLTVLRIASNSNAALRNVTDLKLHAELLLIESVSGLKNIEEDSISSFLTEEFLDRMISLETKISFLMEGGSFVSSEDKNDKTVKSVEKKILVEKKKIEEISDKFLHKPKEEKKKTEINENNEPVGELSFDSIVNMWDLILKEVKEKKAQTHAMLVEGKPKSLENDTLIIGFQAKFDWHANQLIEKKRLNDIELAIYNLYRKRIFVKIEIEGENSNEEKNNKKVEEGELVDTILNLFGGEIEK